MKSKTQNKLDVAVFVDLIEVLDTMKRDTLWTILAKLRCPRKFVHLIHQFHDAQSLVLSSDVISK